MIVPSIDIQDGSTVQLIGGREKALDAGDPRTVAASFAPAGTVAVIDLDAAMGRGDNATIIAEIVRHHRVRVGGGIRTVEAARRWLDLGAEAVILGTAARPELHRQRPRERVVAAVDAIDGEVVVEGWTTRTGAGLLDTVRSLAPHVGGFLVTFVEREGRLGGTALEQVPAIVAAAGQARVTIAGGVTTAAEVAQLDRMGADAQVGMALYTGRLSLAEAVSAPLVSDRPDGLWPTLVCDPHGVSLGLAWSNLESLSAALERGRGVYWSRRRGLWEKGATSGAGQRLLRVDADCDRDALRFVVEQAGPGFCHEHTWSCFGETQGLGALDRTLQARAAAPPPGSYTARLLDDPDLLRAKLMEESGELMAASEPSHVAEEAADLLYFTLVAAARQGVSLTDIVRVLDRRALRTTRRKGDAKPPPPLPRGDAP
ncbi:MAG: phosphoribosyl-ATP diphosphatase [Myxococcota bacterium]|nr:phosphoribosyl-ATP diphosphatase [Myxococcota bacterium]